MGSWWYRLLSATLPSIPVLKVSGLWVWLLSLLLSMVQANYTNFISLMKTQLNASPLNHDPNSGCSLSACSTRVYPPRVLVSSIVKKNSRMRAFGGNHNLESEQRRSSRSLIYHQLLATNPAEGEKTRRRRTVCPRSQVRTMFEPYFNDLFYISNWIRVWMYQFICKCANIRDQFRFGSACLPACFWAYSWAATEYLVVFFPSKALEPK